MSRPEIIVYRDEWDGICISLDGGFTYVRVADSSECNICSPGEVAVSPPHTVGVGDPITEVWRSGPES